MSLCNMKAELKRFGITQAEVARFLGMSTNNFSLKINEKIPMTVEEARKINERFLPTVKLDYLLQSDGDTPTTEQIIEERNKLRTFRGIAPELEEPFGSALDEVVGESVDALNAEIARRTARE